MGGGRLGEWHGNQPVLVFQPFEMQQTLALAETGIDLLQGDDVGRHLADHIDDSAGIALSIGADAFVDIVGRHHQTLGPGPGNARHLLGPASDGADRG